MPRPNIAPHWQPIHADMQETSQRAVAGEIGGPVAALHQLLDHRLQRATPPGAAPMPPEEAVIRFVSRLAGPLALAGTAGLLIHFLLG